MTWKTALVATVLMLVAVVLAPSSPATADSDPLGPDGHCGRGEARRVANAFYPLFFNAESTAEFATLLCQFRTFLEPDAGICFDEHDVFVAGIVFSGGDADRSLIAGTELTLSVVEPTGVVAESVETPLKRANGTEPRTSWKQWSLTFADLAPGTYRVATDVNFPNEWEDEHFEVGFTVLPHEVAQGLGRPTFGGEGSVVCPDDLPT